MRLTEAIDLFRRRFRFVAIDDGVNFVCVNLKPTRTEFLVNVRAQTPSNEVIRIQTAYMRMLEDIPDISVKVVPHERWVHNSSYKLIWTKEGLATAMPKA